MNEFGLSDCYVSPALARLLDQRCDRFEAEWKAGRYPRLEDYLTDVPGTDRSVLLGELLAVELAYRCRTGGAPDPADYRKRFPGEEERIRSAWAEAQPREAPARWSPVVDSQGPTRILNAGGGKTANGDQGLPAFIGKYRIIERLGRGAQGEVFRAVHPELPGRDVVIKWARATLAKEPYARLRDEGRLLARLEDPGLVRIHDVDVYQDRPFMVLEYVNGRSLQERLKEGLPSLQESARLAAQLAATLERVHSRGVCHRDLKPANVLLDASGQPRLLDFGLAWQLTDTDRTGEGICGTLQYMAPEQANNRADQIGPRTDVFGLGALLYHLLTGRPPYQGSERQALWQQARQGAIVPPRQINPRVPPRLERICLKALAADPSRRYTSANEMERALRGYLARPRWLRAAALGAVVALGAAALALVAWPSRPDANAAIAELTAKEAEAVLSGELLVTVWGGSKVGLRIDEPGGLPVRNGDLVHLEARLNRSGYIYLLLLSEGKTQPLYPWDPAKGIGQPAPPDRPRQTLHSPPERNRGWEVAGPSGLDSVLLLARRTPLPDGVDLSRLIGSVPLTPLRSPFEVAWRGFNPGEQTVAIDRGRDRGFKTEARKIDEPLLALMERLRPRFEMIRAVRYAHQGE